MKNLMLVFVGGGLGSVARMLLSRWTQTKAFASFPVGTLLVNVLASFVLGLILARFTHHESVKILFAVGFCGGFSTFSTFSNDTLQLIQQGRSAEAFTNILLNVTLCLLATYAGLNCE